MTNNLSPIPTPTRLDRFSVCLACQLGTTEALHEGTVFNISFGGFGIELDSAAHELDMARLRTVNVDILGTFDVESRWSRGNRIGVRFTDEDGAKGRIQKYLDAHGLAQR